MSNPSIQTLEKIFPEAEISMNSDQNSIDVWLLGKCKIIIKEDKTEVISIIPVPDIIGHLKALGIKNIKTV